MPSTTFPKIDLPKMEMPKFELPEIDTDKLVDTARDAAYITVGLGVLAFQRVNTARRDLAGVLEDRYANRKDRFDDLITKAKDNVLDFDDRLMSAEAKLDGAVESLNAKLPERAATLVAQAHDAVKGARKQVHVLVRKAG